VSQVTGEGEALRAARATAAQLKKFDRATAAAAKRFIKLFRRRSAQRDRFVLRTVCESGGEAGLRKFVERTDAQPYLP